MMKHSYTVTQKDVELKSGLGYNHYIATQKRGFLGEQTKQIRLVQRKKGFLAGEKKVLH